MARKSKYNAAPVLEIESGATWKVAIYLRLSVEDGDDIEQNSIGNQKKLCLAYLADKKDMSVENVYTDHGYSGMSYKRPGFIEMYEAITQGLINCVIVKDISRFGREYLATSEFLQRTFPMMGIRFISLNDDYDSECPNADVEGLLLPFKMILNDSYAKDTSVRIRSSINAKMNNGEYLPSSSSIPYGYLRNPEKNTFDIDPEAALIVKEIFMMRADGMAFNAIAKKLIDEGAVSPGKLRYLRGSNKDSRFATASWTRGTIRKITGDPVYLGNRVHGKIKRDKLGEDKTKRDKSEWQIIPNAHPAIISDELFDAVQAVNKAELERRGQFNERTKPEDDCRDLLREKVFCGDCGVRMIAMKRNQRLTSDLPPVIFYQCNNYKYSHNVNCSNHYTRSELILATMKKVIDQQVAIAADIEAAMIAASRTPRIIKRGDSNGLQSIRTRRKNLEAKLEQLLINLTDGLLNRDEYDYMKARYTQERNALMEEEREAELKLLEAKETYNTAQRWLNSLKQYGKVPTLNKELIDLIIDKVYVFNDKRIQVVLNYGDPYKAFASILTDTEVLDHVG